MLCRLFAGINWFAWVRSVACCPSLSRAVLGQESGFEELVDGRGVSDGIDGFRVGWIGAMGERGLRGQALSQMRKGVILESRIWED